MMNKTIKGGLLGLLGGAIIGTIPFIAHPYAKQCLIEAKNNPIVKKVLEAGANSKEDLREQVANLSNNGTNDEKLAWHRYIISKRTASTTKYAPYGCMLYGAFGVAFTASRNPKAEER